MTLRSPLSGRLLVADTAHSLAAPGERWPVVDGIPYLRTDSEGLVALALDHLDAGRHDEALVALLTDQDAWWTGPATDLAELRTLVERRHDLSLREAMALLRMGPVADYFAHRWGDPTYLAGLALIEAHWQAPATAFELACGIGHYLRDLGRAGVACTAADVVFAKCWLAKHWVAPEADYVVFDAGAPWPVAERRFDLVMCHDAFYFLPDQPRVADALRKLTAPAGLLAVSHLHNAGYHGGAMGPARSAGEWAALFPTATVHDERALLMALMTQTAPAASTWTPDDAVEAWSLVERHAPAATMPQAAAVTGGVAMPPADARLRPHPLLAPTEGDGLGGVAWPSDRYRDEYGAGSFWAMSAPERAERGLAGVDDVRLRRLVDLPTRW